MLLTEMASKIPRLVANIDIRRFKLDPTDGFLLTRVDGRLSPPELARETGLPEFQIDKTLEKLERLGVIEFVDPDAPATPAKSVPPPPPPRERAQLPEFASLGFDARYDPKELEEVVDLSADQKRRILDLYYRLEDIDHYTLLGIGRDADKKTIKRSYFELASAMHPDRYFKKNLGSFKGKMEQLFGRVTEAHDTLVDAAKRLDYDSYLDETATTKGMEAMLERATFEARRTAALQAEEARPSTHPSSAPPLAPSAPAPAMVDTPPAAELQARREALAKRLVGGGSVRPPMPTTPPPDARIYTNTEDAVDALRRRYQERIESASVDQAKRYGRTADEALAKNDIAAAASALHMATKLAPDDPVYAARYDEVRKRADEVLSESYIKQATYEERASRWPEAAKNWRKVAKIRTTDANAHARAAHCMLMANDPDLQAAAEHAKEAVAAAPNVVKNHITAAEIYLRAGKTASAKRAAETGLALEPKNATLLAILKKATKK